MAIIDRELMQSQMTSGAKWDVAVAIKRGNPLPLDNSSVFFSLEDAQNYAATSPIAYPTQIIAVVGDDGVNSYYGITQDGGLEAIGGAVDVDDKSIMLEGEKLSLKNFGKQYYAYDSETGEYATTPTNGFKANLVPRVVATSEGGYELAWYEPSTVTVEDVSAIVSGLQTSVETNTSGIAALNLKLEGMYTNEQIDEKFNSTFPEWEDI